MLCIVAEVCLHIFLQSIWISKFEYIITDKTRLGQAYRFIFQVNVVVMDRNNGKSQDNTWFNITTLNAQKKIKKLKTMQKSSIKNKTGDILK